MKKLLDKNFLLLSITFVFIPFIGLFATIFKVGPEQEYHSPNQLYLANVLADGDTVEIDAAVYFGIDALAVWANNNLLIKGVGGRPHLKADGQYIWGKGIWVCAGDNITVEHIEFSEAAVPSNNGAGIRLDGNGLTVRFCYFHHNENGILTNNTLAGMVLIEFSEFAFNGHGDGFSHNIYVGKIEKLVLRYNYIHHAVVGHNIKSRANENHIHYNRIMDEESGNSSRLIDLPNGGLAIIMGNLLMQGVNAENKNLIAYGLEGLTNISPPYLYVINNSCVNKRIQSSLFVDIADGTAIANISNNIFAGVVSPEICVGPVSDFTANLIEEEIAAIHFVDELNYNYNLLPESPAIDAGSAIEPGSGYNLIPDKVYVHPADYGERAIHGAIDIGAYEINTPASTTFYVNETYLHCFPNPAGEIMFFQNSKSIRNIQFINLAGKAVNAPFSKDCIDLTGIETGLYIVKVIFDDGEIATRKIIRK